MPWDDARLPIEVSVRVDAHCRRREQLWCDGHRIEQRALLALACPNLACAAAVETKARWRTWRASQPAPARGQAKGSGQQSGQAPASRCQSQEAGPRPFRTWRVAQAPRGLAALAPAPLYEVPLRVAGLSCMARRAWLPSLVYCPENAHEPKEVVHTGYDLFDEAGNYLCGGARHEGGTFLPRLPDLAAARAHVCLGNAMMLAALQRRPLEHLELSVRTCQALRAEGLRTVGDLVQHTQEELLRSPWIGRRSLLDVSRTLADHGLALRSP